MAWSDSSFGAAVGFDDLAGLLEDELARDSLPMEALATAAADGEELFKRMPDVEREKAEVEWRDLAVESMPVLPTAAVAADAGAAEVGGDFQEDEEGGDGDAQTDMGDDDEDV